MTGQSEDNGRDWSVHPPFIAPAYKSTVLRGPADVLEPRLENGLQRLDHPLVTVEERGSIVTSDGVELRFVEARIEEGVIAGDALSYFLAYGPVGTDFLL